MTQFAFMWACIGVMMQVDRALDRLPTTLRDFKEVAESTFVGIDSPVAIEEYKIVTSEELREKYEWMRDADTTEDATPRVVFPKGRRFRA